MDALWTQFFKAKYLNNGQHLREMKPEKGTRFWRSIARVIPEVFERIRVQIKEGSASFWFDRWLASGPLCAQVQEISHHKIQIRECWDRDGWNVDLLVDLLGEEQAEEVMNSAISLLVKRVQIQ